MIRQFRIRTDGAETSGNAPIETWIPCTRETVDDFPALGYSFARDLHRRFEIPFGIVAVARSGATLDACAAMAAPIVPLSLRGILWCQGESDIARGRGYGDRFCRAILSWRAQFAQGDLPFLWVQLPNHRDAEDKSGASRALLREAQASALKLPATGQAVTIDIGDPRSPRPSDDPEVARRLALIAKATVYHVPSDYSGPVFKAAVREGSVMRVHFKFADNGLTAADKPLQAFELAGPDRRFFPASAAISGDTVVVRSPQVPEPMAVRYAWRNDPEANLFNGAGLPAAPFRSDDW